MNESPNPPELIATHRPEIPPAPEVWVVQYITNGYWSAIVSQNEYYARSFARAQVGPYRLHRIPSESEPARVHPAVEAVKRYLAALNSWTPAEEYLAALNALRAIADGAPAQPDPHEGPIDLSGEKIVMARGMNMDAIARAERAEARVKELEDACKGLLEGLDVHWVTTPEGMGVIASACAALCVKCGHPVVLGRTGFMYGRSTEPDGHPSGVIPDSRRAMHYDGKCSTQAPAVEKARVVEGTHPDDAGEWFVRRGDEVLTLTAGRWVRWQDGFFHGNSTRDRAISHARQHGVELDDSTPNSPEVNRE